MSVFSFIVLLLPLNYSSGGGHANGNDCSFCPSPAVHHDHGPWPTNVQFNMNSPRLWVHCGPTG
jgi:hypothetical protein